MGDFADCPKWTLVNDFTIHEDRNLKDRPFMLTCVPQVIEVVVTSFEVVHSVAWPSQYGTDVGARLNTYTDQSFIRFGGTFSDSITVFQMSTGEIGTFEELTGGRISALPAGSIGGRNRASELDGVPYAGMTSHKVPDAGLMEGEPGKLLFSRRSQEAPDGTEAQGYLTAELYLDEDKFISILETLREASSIDDFKIYIQAELFESEMSASLSEYWMPREYGLLSKSEAFAQTHARLDRISVCTGVKQLTPSAHPESNVSVGVKPQAEPEVQARQVVLSQHSSENVRYHRYVLAALIVLIAVVAFSR